MPSAARVAARPPAAATLSKGASALIAKHAEFEKAARAMRCATRSVKTTPRGIEQIVVHKAGSVLRWPTSYARGEAPTRAAVDAAGAAATTVTLSVSDEE